MSDDAIKGALDRAQGVLDTAYYGLAILRGADRSVRSAGLRNVLVFGRSTTFVIQNLRSIVGEKEFEQWYAPHQAAMKADPVMRYFVEARNNLEKQGRLDTAVSAHIHNFNSGDIRKFGTPPPGARAFFMGDQTGGSGWEVELPNGEVIKYYVNIPQSIADVRQVFTNMPDDVPAELKGLAVEDLCEIVLGRISEVLVDARKRFLGAKKLPPYIRIIK